MKCSICGGQFTPRKNEHYISRDTSKSAGVAAVITGYDEDQWYDTFDCPICGCQIVAQKRNRMVVAPISEEERENEK